MDRYIEDWQNVRVHHSIKSSKQRYYKEAIDFKMSNDSICKICNSPVGNSQDACFLGWLDGRCCWQHKTCENDYLSG
jgi:hypothetical protein